MSYPLRSQGVDARPQRCAKVSSPPRCARSSNKPMPRRSWPLHTSVVEQLNERSRRPPSCSRMRVMTSWPSPRPPGALAADLVQQPLERLNREVRRRTDVVGIFPNRGAVTRSCRRHPRGAERRVARGSSLHEHRVTGQGTDETSSMVRTSRSKGR